MVKLSRTSRTLGALAGFSSAGGGDAGTAALGDAGLTAEDLGAVGALAVALRPTAFTGSFGAALFAGLASGGVSCLAAGLGVRGDTAFAAADFSAITGAGIEAELMRTPFIGGLV
jgi:hypothetical protein